MATVPLARPSMVSDAHDLAAKDLRRCHSYLASPILSHLLTVVSDAVHPCPFWRWIASWTALALRVFARVAMSKIGQEAMLP